ncbi:MAG: DUF2723 domain-containing protein, partial [Roseiflexaceae bacterium]|nr:DUF2723 domain-containing protein [Roseiflexaceae bacterium]
MDRIQTRSVVQLRLGTLALLALVGLGFALRLYRLDAQSLWLDEGGTWAEVTRQSWGFLLADLMRPTAAYPLYHLLLKGWIAIVGDSEWALRLPSALAGTALVLVTVLAATEVHRHGKNARYRLILPTLLAAISPYALWHAQDAKVYSLLMLVVALMLWAGLRYCRLQIANYRLRWRSLALVLAISVVSLFVHRLALLPAAGLLLALGITAGRTRPTIRTRFEAPGYWTVPRLVALALFGGALASGVLGVAGLAGSVAPNGWQESGHSAASPLQSVWLNLQHFILDRGDIGGLFGLPLVVWMLPGLLLTVWGFVLLLRDTWRGNLPATLVLCMFAVPLLLFAAALIRTPVYEARYAAVAFPAWLLMCAWPVLQNKEQRTENREQRTENREQRTENRKQKNREQRTENREQRTNDFMADQALRL